MNGWLKALLGVKDREIPADAVVSFEFANLPRGAAALLVLLVFLALVAGVFWIYRREGSAPRRAKYGLATVRTLILACAFLVVLEPVLSVDQVQQIEKSTILLLDGSLSMTVRDRYRKAAARDAVSNAFDGIDPTSLKRYELVNTALAASGLPGSLARNNELRVFEFSNTLRDHATLPRLGAGESSPRIPPLDPEANEESRKAAARGTNLASAIREAVERVGSDRVAGIVMLSDGRHTVGPPAEDIAVYLKNKDIALHTVLVGQDEALWNLRAAALAGPDRAYRNDPVSFEAQVSARGYATSPVVFERRYLDGSESWSTIKSENVSFPADDQPVPLKFADRPPRVGSVEYRIRLERREDESTHKDNERSFVVRVVEEKAKVLLVAGGPAHEYYAIKNVLLRDRTITLACFLQSADPAFPQDGNDISLRALPPDEKSLFAFDVVILHDPDGDLFPPGWPKLLRKFVSEHRGGLCFIAGNKHTLRLLRQRGEENDLTDLLPVVLDLNRADMPGVGIGYGAYFKTPWRMEPEPEAFTHPATRFHSDSRRARDLVWDRLPPFYWFFPTLKEKPGARVLARHEDPRERVEPYGRRPIIAVHRYGGGLVMFLAADETHRWRSVAEPVFDRFWVQTARFLLEGRHSGVRRRFRIYSDRDIVNLGDGTRITVEAFDPSFEPYEAEKVSVLVHGPGDLEEEVVLLPVTGKVGRYSGSMTPSVEGDYALGPADAQFKASDGGESPSASFLVILPDLEMGNVRADRTLLKDLAARTRGTFVPVQRIRDLARPELIPPASERVVTSGRPIPLWDTWTTILVLLGLLCVEWIVRKRMKMV